MKFESFMENLYFGKLDKKRIDYFESPIDDQKVQEIINKYREATKDFPPDKLESLGRVPNELLSELKKIGFFGLFIPKEYGGVGLSLYQYLALVKEIVKLDMAVGILSLAHLSIGMKAIMLFGSKEQKKKYLPIAASGEMIFSYALTEPFIGSDAKNVDTIAELSDDGKFYILNGSKTFITNANYAGGLTVFAQTEKNKKGKLGAFIVETGWEGVTIAKDVEKMGLKASSTAAMQFKNVKVPAENLIGKPGDGFKIAMTVLNYGRLALGAASSGMLEASLCDMLKRTRNRMQFEKHIIEFELIQEKIVRAFVDNESVWAMTNFTAKLLEKDPVSLVAVESSHCKLYGTNKAWETLYEAMQAAGGSGYLKANPYEKRMRDFRVATIFEGTTEIHSIYPPISILRNLIKLLFVKGRPFVLRTAIILFLYFKPALWKTGDKETDVRKSLKAVKIYSKIFRKMFISSLLKYGKKLPEREFLLRRLTSISCQIFGLISMSMKIKAYRNHDINYDKTLTALKYFLESSKNIVKKNRRVTPDRIEKTHRKVIDFLK